MKYYSLFDVASKITKPYLKNYEEYLLLLIENWTELVPPAWRHKTLPVKFKWLSDHKAILIVTAISKASTLHFTFEAPAVITQLNTFFGREIITQITFK